MAFPDSDREKAVVGLMFAMHPTLPVPLEMQFCISEMCKLLFLPPSVIAWNLTQSLVWTSILENIKSDYPHLSESEIEELCKLFMSGKKSLSETLDEAKRLNQANKDKPKIERAKEVAAQKLKLEKERAEAISNASQLEWTDEPLAAFPLRSGDESPS